MSRHLDVFDAAAYFHVRLLAVVCLDQPLFTLCALLVEAGEIDDLVTLDGRPAALVLPAAHGHDDVHDSMV